jgi:hypothetical protein
MIADSFNIAVPSNNMKGKLPPVADLAWMLVYD